MQDSSQKKIEEIEAVRPIRYGTLKVLGCVAVWYLLMHLMAFAGLDFSNFSLTTWTFAAMGMITLALLGVGRRSLLRYISNNVIGHDVWLWMTSEDDWNFEVSRSPLVPSRAVADSSSNKGICLRIPLGGLRSLRRWGEVVRFGGWLAMDPLVYWRVDWVSHQRSLSFTEPSLRLTHHGSFTCSFETYLPRAFSLLTYPDGMVWNLAEALLGYDELKEKLYRAHEENRQLKGQLDFIENRRSGIAI